MHPTDFFQNFWRPDQLNEIFVIMPYAKENDDFWQLVVKPSAELAFGPELVAKRTDVNLFSGSVMVDVFDRIAKSKLIIADISATSVNGTQVFRNDNVMYELGLAHPVRHSSETIVIRRDTYAINFDLSNTLVHTINITNLSQAKKQLASILTNALGNISFEKNLIFQRTLRRLDSHAKYFLSKVRKNGIITISMIGDRYDLQSLDARVMMRIHYTNLFLELGIAEQIESTSGNSTDLALTHFGSEIAKNCRLKFEV
jgi:hypothetical protein